VNQSQLREMAIKRIRDANALLRGGRWEFSYYAAGYAVECALKSCLLARMVYTGWVFEEKWKADVCRSHDFGELIKLADLTNELNARLAASAASGGAFVAHWGTVIQWSVTSRYASKTETEARDLFAAITHKPDGVLRWLRNYW